MNQNSRVTLGRCPLRSALRTHARHGTRSESDPKRTWQETAQAGHYLRARDGDAQSASGHPEPSRDDIEMTKEIAKAAEALGIAIHDHLVIGRKGHASFRSLGLLT